MRELAYIIDCTNGPTYSRFVTRTDPNNISNLL